MPKQWLNCWYCGCQLIVGKKDHPCQQTMDHFKPASEGGDRFVYACKRCNNLKSQSSVEEFREWLGVDLFFGERMGWEPW